MVVLLAKMEINVLFTLDSESKKNPKMKIVYSYLIFKKQKYHKMKIVYYSESKEEN